MSGAGVTLDLRKPHSKQDKDQTKITIYPCLSEDEPKTMAPEAYGLGRHLGGGMKAEGKKSFDARNDFSLFFWEGVLSQQPQALAALSNCAELQAYRDALDRAAIIATTDLAGHITDVNDRFSIAV